LGALASRGILLELSSAAALHGAQSLADRGLLDHHSTAVLLGTAGLFAKPNLIGCRRLTEPDGPH
jgi:threonine synthase